MSQTLLEEVFRNMFDVPLVPDDIPVPDRRNEGCVFGYRERLDARQTTSPQERADDERRDLEDTFGIYESPWDYLEAIL